MGRNGKNQGEPVKKAQITIFIIIGALVLVAFGITFYVGSKMGQRIETKETTQRIEQLGIQPIQDYITTCLSLATTEGLSLIGRQGGAIYKKQGGLTQDHIEGEGEKYVKYTDPDLGILDVSFLIHPPMENVGQLGCQQSKTCLFYSEPPTYPFEGFPYLPDGSTLFNGYYGISKLPPLYKISQDAERKKVEGSIQENLETFIAKRTTDCVNWKTFQEKGYTITAGTADASLLFAEKEQVEKFVASGAFGEQHISVELLWPIEVATPGGDKTILKDFAIKTQVRLVTIYYTIKAMIDGDVTDVSYTPESKGEFSTLILPYGHNSFIITKDAQSMVGNKPFEFWIPRKNRRPAIWKIDTTPLKGITLHITPDGTGTRIKIVKINDNESQIEFEDPCPTETLPIIKLRASDPDEDPVSFAVHIPASTNDRIPQDAVNFEKFSITIYAKDRSQHDNNWFDSEEIIFQDVPMQVGICEVR